MTARYLLALLGFIACAVPADAGEVRVLTSGAMKEVVLGVLPEFERATGHRAVVANDTAGGLTRRILGGETFDLVVVTPAAIDDLTAKGKVSGARINIARVGVGVVVKDGAPRPDIATVAAFRKALLDAKSVAYIDPASGGSSGIYIVDLLDKLGIAAEVKPKTKLKQGGHVADLIASGEAEIGLHQISEILAVKGVTLVGPLPAEIQNYTVYAAGVSADAKEGEGARALIKLLAGPAADPVLKARGMERPPS